MKKQTILCVDDDQDDLLLIQESLEDANGNFEIIEARNGRQALDLLQQLKNTNDLPCLIILDFNMPVLNGKETLSLIKKEEALKDIPVVVFTTSGSESDKRYCHMYGVEMMTKPPNFKSFRSIVQMLLKICIS